MSIEETKSALDAIQKSVDEKMGRVNDLEAKGEKTSAAIEDLNGSLKSFNAKFDQLQAEITDLAQKGLTTEQPITVIKGLGAQLAASDSVKSFAEKKSQGATIEVKNTILNGSGITSFDEQLGGVVGGAFQKLTVLDSVITGQTDSGGIVYAKESNWVNGAAIQVEGDAKAESTLTFTNVNEPVKTIATHLTASKQALRNNSYLEGYIDRRLSHGVRQKTEQQIVAGDGVGENMSGWLAAGNHTVISPLLTTDIFGLTNKLKTAVELNGYNPEVFYMHPSDWSKAETTRRGTGDSAFVGASGAITYVNGGLTPMLWQIPVITSLAVTEGTAICKSRDADMYFAEDALTVTMSNDHNDNFTKNLVTILAESSGVEAVFTAAAICTGDITSIS